MAIDYESIRATSERGKSRGVISAPGAKPASPPSVAKVSTLTAGATEADTLPGWLRNEVNRTQNLQRGIY